MLGVSEGLACWIYSTSDLETLPTGFLHKHDKFIHGYVANILNTSLSVTERGDFVSL